jgi:hypothetical protein
MKNKRFLYGIFLFVILMIGFFAIYIAAFTLPFDIPETENITNFESVDINLPESYQEFYYSFVPDGSGILYVHMMPRENASDETFRFIFYYLDFASRGTEIIHEADFTESTPVIYWRDARIAFLGAERFYGECSLNGSINFNLNTNQETPSDCSTGVGLMNPEVETRDYPHIYTRDDLDQRVEIHSMDGKYYFLWRLEYDCISLICLGEVDAKNYLEIYNMNDEMIRRIYLGETGQMTTGPLHTGYVGYWSNTNQIVVIPSTAKRYVDHNDYRAYFIDPEK